MSLIISFSTEITNIFIKFAVYSIDKQSSWLIYLEFILQADIHAISSKRTIDFLQGSYSNRKLKIIMIYFFPTTVKTIKAEH